MCQEKASFTCKKVVDALVEAESDCIILNCTTGFHRAETISKCTATLLSSHTSLAVLHLSTCRDSLDDLVHTARLAKQWLAKPWMAAFEMAHADLFWLRSAVKSRPEAWANFHDFEVSWINLAGFAVFYIV